MSETKSVEQFKSYESRAINGNEKEYIRLTVSLTSSTAFMQLSALSKWLYLAMLFEAKGHEEVIITGQKCAEQYGISDASYKRCVKQLMQYGFIEKCPRNCFAPSRFRFSEKWKNW